MDTIWHDLSERFSRDRYLVLKGEARETNNDWGAGGTYRQIATALTAGISGNVTGGASQFAQNMVVNYLQQQGSAAIGDMVRDGLGEGSPEHAALHAILGCAGAAASRQSCSAGAMGGAASSLLTQLFSETSADESAPEPVIKTVAGTAVQARRVSSLALIYYSVTVPRLWQSKMQIANSRFTGHAASQRAPKYRHQAASVRSRRSTEVESLELYAPEGKTYNLTVDAGHMFYVGEIKT